MSDIAPTHARAKRSPLRDSRLSDRFRYRYPPPLSFVSLRNFVSNPLKRNLRTRARRVTKKDAIACPQTLSDREGRPHRLCMAWCRFRWPGESHQGCRRVDTGPTVDSGERPIVCACLGAGFVACKGPGKLSRGVVITIQPTTFTVSHTVRSVSQHESDDISTS